MAGRSNRTQCRHRCDISMKGAVVARRTMTRRWVAQTRYILQRNTASLTKVLIWFSSPFLWFKCVLLQGLGDYFKKGRFIWVCVSPLYIFLTMLC